VVDELSQWTARTWSGKTADESALKGQLSDALQAAARAKFPTEWSRFGGWK
jgi:hypothetical protein